MKVGIVNKSGDIFIGSMTFPDRKKPCLVIEQGNECVVIGTFNNEKCVATFHDALLKIWGDMYGR